ncbi:MAG: hypothetical protein CFE46_01030 [Burkholderiales bacterium PBB6]|nr:MAG: hypothetical protein CFE46_01030 [Burkholderiales bacterium PBB6]
MDLIRSAGHRPSSRLWLSICTAWMALSAHSAHAADAGTEEFFRRSSSCVAALKADVAPLIARYKAGATQTRPDILKLTELGFTFAGTAYLRGLRNPQADTLMQDAEKAQKAQGTEQLKALSQACQSEGQALYRKANFIERALVKNKAQSRVEHLLGPEDKR